MNTMTIAILVIAAILVTFKIIQLLNDKQVMVVDPRLIQDIKQLKPILQNVRDVLQIVQLFISQ